MNVAHPIKVDHKLLSPVNSTSKTNATRPTRLKRKVRAHSAEKLKPRRTFEEEDPIDGSNPNCHKVAMESPNIFISNLQEEDYDVLVSPREDGKEMEEEPVGSAVIERQQS